MRRASPMGWFAYWSQHDQVAAAVRMLPGTLLTQPMVAADGSGTISGKSARMGRHSRPAKHPTTFSAANTSSSSSHLRSK
ncbi:hypothetical protein ABZ815_51550 [Nonomuraea sp. NPDC047529]|uniref:hypothetical protein n=1 Tax=Nonomuraea sp. NPDC047529 TaxID=3155623 RepID=UPI0033F87B15